MSTDVISSSMDASGYYLYEIAATRMVAGSPDEVRTRLAEAFERLGYHVVDERPLIAQRRTKGWASAGCSTNVAVSPTTVRAKIKDAGPAASHVTFTYTIRTMGLSKGDRRVISLEADALVALARSRTGSSTCGRCATDVADDSRFCRRCGAPVEAAEPAEVDVFRLAAASHNAYLKLAVGVAAAIASIVLVALALWVPSLGLEKAAKIAMALMLFGALAGALSLSMLVMATGRLKAGLDALVTDRDSDRSPSARSSRDPHTTARLAAPAEPLSVTEGTTSLLAAEEPVAPTPARVRVRTTA